MRCKQAGRLIIVFSEPCYSMTTITVSKQVNLISKRANFNSENKKVLFCSVKREVSNDLLCKAFSNLVVLHGDVLFGYFNCVSLGQRNMRRKNNSFIGFMVINDIFINDVTIVFIVLSRLVC